MNLINNGIAEKKHAPSTTPEEKNDRFLFQIPLEDVPLAFGDKPFESVVWDDVTDFLDTDEE